MSTSPNTNTSRPNRRMTTVLFSLLAVISIAAGACAVPDPGPTVPANWGANIAPDHADVPYVTGAALGCGAGQNQSPCGGSQTLDIFKAKAGGSRGTIVFIHGGGFTGGDKSLREEVGPILRETHRGWDVVLVNYRLASVATGTNLFPAAVRDVSQALGWLKVWGPGLGLNTSRFVTAGHSAGGAIASLIGTAWNSGRAEFAGIPRVNGYISIAGIQDFVNEGTGIFWGNFWFPHRAWAPVASPITYLDAQDPHGWFIHGDQDPMVSPEHSRRMKNAADAGGFGGNIHLDIVDRSADGAWLPATVRSHNPIGGANIGELDAWLDSL